MESEKSENLISSGSREPIFVLQLPHNKVSSNFLSATEREQFAFSSRYEWKHGLQQSREEKTADEEKRADDDC
jgi:hypothetical protein